MDGNSEQLQVINLKQLPIIEERLRDVKAKIEQRTSAVMALAVTEETRTDVKKIRTEVRKELEGYEAQRMAVKKAIMTPYEQFEAVYKECLSPIWGAYNADDLRKAADANDAWDKSQVSIYKRKTGFSDTVLLHMMADTTYMTGKEAVEKGFADELLDDAEPLEISANADSQTISCKGHALRLMPGVKLPDNIPLAKASAPVAPAAANTKTAVEPANTNEGGQTPMANETNGAQNPTPAVENPQVAVDAAVSAERHRLEEIDQIAGLFNAEMVHEAKYGATACDARELAFRAAQQATQQGRDFLTALGTDNQQSGTQSVSAVPGESAEGSPEATHAELTPAEKMAAARRSVKALLHPETNKEGKNNG